MSNTQITSPNEDDWQWIYDALAETVWTSLAPSVQITVTIHQVHASLAGQNENLRTEHGVTNQIFVARDKNDKGAGYVRVGQIKSGFTGALHAHIYNVFVVEEFRGQRGRHAFDESRRGLDSPTSNETDQFECVSIQPTCHSNVRKPGLLNRIISHGKGAGLKHIQRKLLIYTTHATYSHQTRTKRYRIYADSRSHL